MSVRVRIPTPPRMHAGERSEVTSEGSTLREVFADLERRFPGFRQALYDVDGTMRRFINVYLTDEDIHHIDAKTAPVKDGNVVSILPPIAGNS